MLIIFSKFEIQLYILVYTKLKQLKFVNSDYAKASQLVTNQLDYFRKKARMLNVSKKARILQRQKSHKGKRLSAYKVKGGKSCKEVKYRKVGIFL